MSEGFHWRWEEHGDELKEWFEHYLEHHPLPQAPLPKWRWEEHADELDEWLRKRHEKKED
jgi:hypothetical protein